MRSRLTPRFLQWLATYRLERGEHALGLAAARILAESGESPDLQQAGWGLAGRCLKLDNRLPEAAEAFEKALALKEATAYASEAALELGMYSLETDRPEEALAYLNKAAGWSAAGAAPGIRPRAYFGLAKTHQALGSMQEAARYYMSVAILYDDPEIVPECLYQSAQIYRGQGLEEDARKTAMELKSRYPASPWAARPMSREAGQ